MKDTYKDVAKDTLRPSSPPSPAVAVASAVARSTTTTVRRKKRVAVQDTRPPLTPAERQSLWQVIRAVAYTPDGKAPTTVRTRAGAVYAWDERRDGSILKALAKRYDASQIEMAIRGVRLLADRGDVAWLGEGKFTLLSLYQNSSGVADVFGLAVATYTKSIERAAPKAVGPKRQLEPLAAIVASVMPR